MDTTLAVVLVLLALLALAAAYARTRRAQRPRRRRSSREIRAHERALAAQFEIEEHDIGEMIEAREAIRRRRGRPSIGDEIEEDLRRLEDE